VLELYKNHLEKVNNICGANRNCQYYPCHYDGQVCLWCFCPFYPCNDENYGELIKRKDGSTIWSCMSCSWVHKPEIACEILKEILLITHTKSNKEAIEIFNNHKLILEIREKIINKYSDKD